ncbi:MAG: Gfo/Idh/MocA family oxidoreductase [Kiritimatiellae bacterium]|nr:Gfo/Idh/MocA family oxidoreductase [Kiritimatiellia bacterium]
MTRKDFIKTSTLAAGVCAAPAILRAEGAKRVFKVGIVGCGGRGNGALGNIHAAAKMLCAEGCNVEIKVVAAADFFVEKAQGVARKYVFDEKFAFGGANGYKEIMKRDDVDVVILTTPLNFRPRHTMAAIEAGKHVFAEKGVAVDGPGCRLMIEASKLAAQKGITIVAGTQRRHQRGYRLIADALKKGIVSPILGGNVYWNGAVPWVKTRAAGMTNAAYLCANWLNFTELSGDHICEQHVHNIDIANWYIGRYPKSAIGFGARARRFSGNQYDFFGIDFDYGEGVHIHSMCRQIDGCSGGGVGEVFRTKDSIISSGSSVRMIDSKKKLDLTGDFRDGNPYDIEHYDLLRSIMKTGPYYNEGEAVAISTACGVIGRMSCYTGQQISLAAILTDKNSKYYNMECVPRPQDFEKDGDVPMPECGDNEWYLPGRPWRGFGKGTKTSDKAVFGAPLGF